jgi:hypothetical protein
MDSLLYIEGGCDEGESEDDDSDEVNGDHPPSASTAGPSQIDFASLSRAGYKSATNLTDTETYKRLDKEAKETKEAETAAEAAEAEAERTRKEACELAQRELLNVKKIDERVGHKKRYAETKEDFRDREKRKRAAGQQSREGSFVEEEKRRIRHSGINFDS